MNISSISGQAVSSGYRPTDAVLMDSAPMGMGAVQKSPEEISRQFEAILVRQLLSESMKPLLEGPGGGQMYGYFISEALADGITKGGGLGIRSILEAQLRLGELDQAPSQDP